LRIVNKGKIGCDDKFSNEGAMLANCLIAAFMMKNMHRTRTCREYVICQTESVPEMLRRIVVDKFADKEPKERGE